MKKFFTLKRIIQIVVLVIIISVIIMIYKVGSQDTETQVTTTVDTGVVRQLVSVSGIAEAEQTADLAFPVGGIVTDVEVGVGDIVETGDTLIKLNTSALYADRQEAVAAINKVVADRDELLAGPTLSARAFTEENVIAKQAALDTTKENEKNKVDNAYRSLLSSNLTAYSNDKNEEAVPPTISGTYQCPSEGKYFIDVFSSNSNSGYSYRLSGLETGTFSASIDQPLPLGNCGLKIKFDSSSSYNRSNWVIEIPNTESPLYITNKNTYDLAVTQSASAIANAEQALRVAESNATDQNAPARDEAITRANASIIQAKSKLNRIDASISDRILSAPFSGTVTEIDILPGETVTSVPVVTLLASSDFEVTARIPEIDIGKLLTGQKVEMAFDAKANEILTGEINFISLKATEIDGVSYFKAVIQPSETPPWLRSGLNADIEIILDQVEGIRIPKRFVTETENNHQVLLLQGETHATKNVEILFEGNDGYYAITGLNEGDIVIAP